MNVAKQLKQAEKLVTYGKVNEAINLYQEILAEDFQNTAVHNLIADLYISKQDFLRAGRHLFKVASDYASQGNPSEAINVYRKILKVQPQNILAREKMMEFHSRTGSKAELFTIMAELCTIYEAEGNGQKVVEYLEKLVSLDPGNKSHQLRLAAFLNDNGLRDKALELFQQLAKDYLREERWDDALEVLARIRSINPKDRNVNFHIAEVFDKQGKVQRAIEVVIANLAEDPTRTDLLAYLAKLCIKAGKVDEAERLYEKLVHSNRGYLPETLPFVEVLIANKKIEKAVCHLASLSQELKDKESQKKCIEYLEEILKLDPQNLSAYQLLESAYNASFQYDQLALTLSAHADAYIAKCDYARALVLTKQLVDLEPYSEECRKKHKFVEKLANGETQSTKFVSSLHETHPADKEDEDIELPSQPEVSLDPNLSIVNEEDVENFLTDVELLEKFGQQPTAIARLEKVLQKYPLELQFRNKLKSLYMDQRMSKKAAQECLEIAKILQTQDKKEEANKYIREAQRLNPVLSTAGKGGSSPVPPPDAKSRQPSDEGYTALKGDLSEISLLDIVQILDTSQKSGKLVVLSEGCEGTIFFNSGKIVDAVYRDRRGEPAMYALVAVKGGSFVYKPSSVSYEVVITNSNTNVILEGLRLLDEANRDSGEFGSTPVEESLPTPSAQPPLLPIASSPVEEPNPPLVSPLKAPVLDENNPLGEW
jgi:tetratricopeptide (TPR) repeat protein